MRKGGNLGAGKSAAGALHFGTHGICYRAMTEIASSGVPTKVGMKLTDHKTVAMFMHYVLTDESWCGMLSN